MKDEQLRAEVEQLKKVTSDLIVKLGHQTVEAIRSVQGDVDALRKRVAALEAAAK